MFLFVAVLGVFISLSGMDLSYKNELKKELLGIILDKVDEELSYYPDMNIIEREILAGKIVKLGGRASIDGEDLVDGYYNGNYIRFSELVVKRYIGGNLKVTTFKGLYLKLEFNKHFHSQTIVVPDVAENLFGYAGKSAQNIISGSKLVYMEDPEFEKLFAVYSDDQVEARYLLSTAFMQKLVETYKKVGPISVSFIEDEMHLAFKTGHDFFKLSTDENLSSPSTVKHFYDDLKFIFDLIDTFELNQKLWSKQ